VTAASGLVVMSSRARQWLRASSLPLVVTVCALTVVEVVARASTFTELDSSNLALAFRHFDVRLDRPHPPGYPLVVAAAHLLAWTGGPLQAYLAFDLLMSGAALVATFFLAREMFGERAGQIAALLVFASPLFLYYASIVSVYPAELFFAPLVVLLAVRTARRSDGWSALALAPVLAVGAGFRPTMLVLLLPVCVTAVVLGRPPLWVPAVGVTIAVGIVAAWSIPMLVKSGGLSGYLRASNLYGRAARETSILGGGTLGRAAYNAGQTLIAILLAAIASLLLLAVGVARHRLSANRRVEWLLIGAWIVPYLGVYALVHFGKPGYALACLPPLAVAAAGVTCDSRFALPASALLAASMVGFFLLVPVKRLPAVLTLFRAPSFIPTAASIRLQDEEAEYLASVSNHCREPSCGIVSLGTARELWEHDPWSLRRSYAPGQQIKRLTDPGQQAPRGSTIYWVGGNVPKAVARYARYVRSVGLWDSYETRGRATSQLEKTVGLIPPSRRLANPEAPR
jgi:4-amino-4-deoxy-L-arabinose transferase-like glycosyltransferase